MADLIISPEAEKALEPLLAEIASIAYMTEQGLRNTCRSDALESEFSLLRDTVARLGWIADIGLRRLGSLNCMHEGKADEWLLPTSCVEKEVAMADDIIDLPMAAKEPLPKQRHWGQYPKGVIPGWKVAQRRKVREAERKRFEARIEAGIKAGIDDATNMRFARAKSLDDFNDSDLLWMLAAHLDQRGLGLQIEGNIVATLRYRVRSYGEAD